MKLEDIKTIDVNAKEWFDRSAGNSYFSAVISINYGMPNQMNLTVPFQYGYDSHYIDCALDELNRKLSLDIPRPLWQLRYTHGVILRTSKETGCRKRDVLNFIA